MLHSFFNQPKNSGEDIHAKLLIGILFFCCVSPNGYQLVCSLNYPVVIANIVNYLKTVKRYPVTVY